MYITNTCLFRPLFPSAVFLSPPGKHVFSAGLCLWQMWGWYLASLWVCVWNGQCEVWYRNMSWMSGTGVFVHVCVVCYGRDSLHLNKSGHTVWLRLWDCYPVGKNSLSLCFTAMNTSSRNQKPVRYHFESVPLTDKTRIHFKRADTMPLDPSTQQGEWPLHPELIKIHKTIMLFKSRGKIHFYWMVWGVLILSRCVRETTGLW